MKPEDKPRAPIRLRPVAERDKALKEHLETTTFLDEETGELWDPQFPPPDLDPEPDD